MSDKCPECGAGIEQSEWQEQDGVCIRVCTECVRPYLEHCPACGAANGDPFTEIDEHTGEEYETYVSFECESVYDISADRFCWVDACKLRVAESRLAESERLRQVAEEALRLLHTGEVCSGPPVVRADCPVRELPCAECSTSVAYALAEAEVDDE